MRPRSKSPARVLQVARRLRWAWVLETGRWLYVHGRQSWERLTPREREELGRIVRKTRDRSGGLTPSEREELRRIVMKAVGIGR
jgi:hypothetical protein